MKICIRTLSGWAELSEREVMRFLACQSWNLGSAVIEHNAYMNRNYPIPKETQ